MPGRSTSQPAPARCVQVGLLQQLSDLALQQSDAKTATLRQLLESEALLDGGLEGEAAEADGGMAGGGSSMPAGAAV